ncbi:MAG: RidA family protein [Promethearchaeota archaeon]
METKRVTSAPGAPAAVGPYSQAVVAGGFAFLAGQVPLDPETGQVVGDSVAEQTERALENVKAVLASLGLDLGDVVRCVVYLTDVSKFQEMNGAYAAAFEPYCKSSGYPARTTVEVSALPKGVKVEVEVTAVVPSG